MAKQAKKTAADTQKTTKRRGRKKPEEELKELVDSGLLTEKEEKKLQTAQELLGKKAGAIGFLADYREKHGKIKIPKTDQYADITNAIVAAIEHVRAFPDEGKKGPFKFPRSGFRVTMGKQTQEMKKKRELPKPIVKAL